MKKQPDAGIPAPSAEVLNDTIEQLRKTIEVQSAMIAELNKSISALKESNITLVSGLRRQIDELSAELKNKDEEIALLRRKLFAPRSEKNRQVEGQMSLEDLGFGTFNEAEAEATVKAVKDPDGTVVVKEHTRKKKATHEELMETLPVRERVIDIEDGLRNCPNCGGPLEYIGKEFLRDEVEIIPRQVIRCKVYRAVYRCPECEIDPGLPSVFKAHYKRLIDHSYLTPSMAAYVLYAKFMLHIPFYRQELDWNQAGVKLNRTTLANWTITVGIEMILPVVDRLWELLMERDLVHCDVQPDPVGNECGEAAGWLQGNLPGMRWIPGL